MNKEAWNTEKFKKMLLDEYHEKFNNNGQPNATLDKLIQCIDNQFMDELMGEAKTIASDIKSEGASAAAKIQIQTAALDSKIQEAKEVTQEAEKKLQAAKDADPIKSEGLAEVLYAYREIVGMKFDAASMELQNVRNASYIIWAWLMKGNSISHDTGFGPFRDMPSSNVEDEVEKDKKRRFDDDYSGWEEITGRRH